MILSTSKKHWLLQPLHEKVKALSIWKTFLISFSALLPLIDPIGSAFVILGLVQDAPEAAFRALARRVAIDNIIFLAVVELLGSAILHFFGVPLPFVQIAGGLVISSLGWSVLNSPDSTGSTREKQATVSVESDTSFSSIQQRAFYPFTFPITSGPGTLVVMLTLSARFSAVPLKQSVFEHLGLLLAVIVLSALVYLCCAYASKIEAALPPSAMQGILRIISFILICIGVQIAWSGASTLLQGAWPAKQIT